MTVVAVAGWWFVWLFDLRAFFGGPVVVLLAERRHLGEGRDRESRRHHCHRKNSSKFLHHYLPPPCLRIHAGEAGSCAAPNFSKLGAKFKFFDAASALKVRRVSVKA